MLFRSQPLQAGICDFIQYVPSSAGDLDSRLGAFDAPYIYRDADHRLAVFDPFNSEPLKVINEALKDDGVMLLSSFNSGYRQITCNFPIRNLSDMKGAKIRVVPSDLYQQLFTAFGAAATPMAFSEVPTALITNVIDGQENPYSVIVSSALYEVQKYCMETNHLPTNHGLWMNRNTYESLTPEQQEAVLKAAYDASAYMDKYILDKVEEYKKIYPVSVILDCFSVKRSTFYRWKARSEKLEKRDEVVEKIEQLCMEHHFIYGYRTITRLLKKIHGLIVNHKKVYRIMKERG